MAPLVDDRRSALADAIFGLLDPIPFGFFVAGLIFDVTYAVSGVILWAKGASWLITLGLLFAVIPRLINVVRVWVTWRRWLGRHERMWFWLNLVAILVAIVNAFIHTQDAYAIVPLNVWLSAITVALMSATHIGIALDRGVLVEPTHA